MGWGGEALFWVVSYCPNRDSIPQTLDSVRDQRLNELFGHAAAGCVLPSVHLLRALTVTSRGWKPMSLSTHLYLHKVHPV